MNAAEKARVRSEVVGIMTRLVLTGHEPQPSRFSHELRRALSACHCADDVLALMSHCVHDVPLIGRRIAAYLAANRDTVIARVAPQLTLLKGGTDADAA